jgi:2-polyprenyl-6-methoxyphenol hydroxylase-like FAD-dependent oxidoreductase
VISKSFDCDVIVAGGGPTGLLTAFLCGEAGIEARVFEAQPDIALDLRATSFHPPTLDMLEPCGITDELIAQGITTTSWQVRLHPAGDRAVFDLATITGDVRHPFRLQCEQWRLSRALLARIVRQSNTAAAFAAKVVGYVQDDTGVDVTVERAGTRETLRARILIGADGLHSTVRQAAGIPFEGEAFPETTLVLTTTFPFDRYMEGIGIVASCWTEKGNIAFLRLRDYWRLAVYLKENVPIEQQITPDGVEAALQEIIAVPERYPVVRAWPYKVNQRIVPYYHTGRVVLVGDAAHVNSPAGALGLNGGIHEAFELTAALVDVLKHGQPVERFALYSRRRRPVVAEEILGQAKRNRNRMREKDPDARRRLLGELQAITRDPEHHHAYVRKASMIDGLRMAAAIS